MPLKMDSLIEIVSRLPAAKRFEQAVHFAVNSSDVFLSDAQSANSNRLQLFQRVFVPLINGYVAQYQPYGFEVVDYELSLPSKLAGRR